MKHDRSCNNCAHRGEFTNSCYKQPSETREVNDAQYYYIMTCRGLFFVKKKAVPNLTFCIDNTFDR